MLVLSRVDLGVFPGSQLPGSALALRSGHRRRACVRSSAPMAVVPREHEHGFVECDVLKGGNGPVLAANATLPLCGEEHDRRL
jgi:hypothetical protein